MPSAQSPEARLFTTRGAAAYLAVSKATLFRAARRGDLNPVRLGPHFTRWPKADLDAWVARSAGGGGGGESDGGEP